MAALQPVQWVAVQVLQRTFLHTMGGLQSSLCWEARGEGRMLSDVSQSTQEPLLLAPCGCFVFTLTPAAGLGVASEMTCLLCRVSTWLVNCFGCIPFRCLSIASLGRRVASSTLPVSNI